jgi:hypothetical protein
MREQLAMMRGQLPWPQGDRLPLKRWAGSERGMEFATIERRAEKLWIRWADGAVEELGDYFHCAALFDAGWRVD